jgi:hypothetical protein
LANRQWACPILIYEIPHRNFAVVLIGSLNHHIPLIRLNLAAQLFKLRRIDCDLSAIIVKDARHGQD